MAGLKLYATPPQGAVAPSSEAHVTPASAAFSMISDDVSTPLVVVRSHTSPSPAHVAVQLSPCAPLNQPEAAMVGRLATEASAAPRRGTRRQRRVGSNPGGPAPTHGSVPSTGRSEEHAASVVAEDHSHTQSSTPSIVSSTPKHDVAPLAAHLHVSAAEQDGRGDEGGADGAPTSAPRRCTRCHRARAPRRSGILLPGSCSSRTGTCWRSTGRAALHWRSRKYSCTNSARRTPTGGSTVRSSSSCSRRRSRSGGSASSVSRRNAGADGGGSTDSPL